MSSPPDPIAELRAHFEKAKATESGDATAMVLATADADGRPSARMVLLKQVDERGFVFFTNYTSRKAAQIEANPHAALCIYWPSLALQVRVEGPVARTSDEESDAYFASRGRGSQLGAWASRQSSPSTPAHAWWRGSPSTRSGSPPTRCRGRRSGAGTGWRRSGSSFWWNRADRLHERRLYTRQGDGWVSTLLYP